MSSTDTNNPDPRNSDTRRPAKYTPPSPPEAKTGVTTDREDVESDGEPKVEVEDVYGSTTVHPFSDPRVAEYWRGIHENAKYGGSHHFDPSFEWTAEEEIRLKRKVDPRIITWAWAMFFVLDLNRRSGNQAISGDMLPELGMDTDDFNTAQTTFLVSLLCAGLPISPCQTAGRSRGKRGLTEREEYTLVNRLLSDDPSKGDMNNHQAVTPSLLWKCLKDYDLWPLYLIGLTVYMPPTPIQQ